MDTAHLIAHIREHSQPLQPLPTGESPRLPELELLKAVVFDIYGTLFISGSGDISLAQAEDRSPAITAALETAGFSIRQPDADWSGAFLQHLESFREARRLEGAEFPEVRIEEVWQDFVEFAKRNGWLEGSGDLQLAIIDHECRVNPCWPMPGIREMLDYWRKAGFRLGIVSNAQFYTPLLFPALLGKTMEDLGFEESISVWSYREREGKPSTGLYRKLASSLEATGIRPSETLYIGNDRRNDIWPAAELGFRTMLFAGDQRSLRWRREDPACQQIQPDGILTDYTQLMECLPAQS